MAARQQSPFRRVFGTTVAAVGYIAYMMYKLPPEDRAAAYERSVGGMSSAFSNFTKDPVSRITNAVQNSTGANTRGCER